MMEFARGRTNILFRMFNSSMKAHPLNAPLSYGWRVTVLFAVKETEDFTFTTYL